MMSRQTTTSGGRPEELKAMDISSPRIALVCAPAGSGFKQAVGRLRTLLSSELGDAAVACEDVEDVLCEGGGATTALEGRLTPGTHVTMKEVTWHLTRT